MFLLLGTRPVLTLLFTAVFACGQCGTRAEQRIVRQQQRLTLFFVPLFSFSTSWFVECAHCGIATALSRQQAEHGAAWAGAREHALR